MTWHSNLFTAIPGKAIPLRHALFTTCSCFRGQCFTDEDWTSSDIAFFSSFHLRFYAESLLANPTAFGQQANPLPAASSTLPGEETATRIQHPAGDIPIQQNW